MNIVSNHKGKYWDNYIYICFFVPGKDPDASKVLQKASNLEIKAEKKNRIMMLFLCQVAFDNLVAL